MSRREALIDRLKLVGAGLFVVGGLLGFVVLIPEKYPSWLTGSLALVVLIVFLALALVLFKMPIGGTAVGNTAERIRKLDEQGLLLSNAYRAKRAFQVEEFDDEGSHYYIELDDRRVLFLSGQYLYDYDSEDQPRAFPCTEFVVRRHRTKGYAVDIVCRGTVLEPEVIAPPFDVHDFDTDVPKDGEIITDKPYDRLKDEWTANLRTPAQ